MKASELKTIEEELVDFTKEYVPIDLDENIESQFRKSFIPIDDMISALIEVRELHPEALFEPHWGDGYQCFETSRFVRKHTAKEIEIKTEELRKKKQAYVKFEIEKLENTIKKLKEIDE